jgi:hypothetical protein
MTFASFWVDSDLQIHSKMPNKPLVPTRTGEAPLLAAQRRRWTA